MDGIVFYKLNFFWKGFFYLILESFFKRGVKSSKWREDRQKEESLLLQIYHGA